MVKSTDAKRTVYLRRVIAHELVHMWFGNMVTPTSWLDLWLSEGSAVFHANMAAATVRSRSSNPMVRNRSRNPTVRNRS